MKVVPPNILLSVTPACAPALLSLFRSGPRAVPYRWLLRERCGVKINGKRSNLAISNGEKLGNITLKPTPAGCLQLITSQGTGLGSVDDQVSHFYRLYHREEAFGRLEVGGLSSHLLYRAVETRECHVVGLE